MPLSKQQFAALVASMPGASDEEILAAAKKAEGGAATPEKSLWEKLNEPLTTLPSKLGSAIGDAVDQRSLDESPMMARVKGFIAGASKGAGDVASSLTSPVNLALTGLGLGAEKAGAEGMLGISQAARAAEAGLQAPMAVEGAKNAYQGVKEGNYGQAGAGAAQVAGALAGIRGAASHAFPVQKVAEAYNVSAGLPAERAAVHEPVKVNPEEAKSVADAYQAMPHNPQDPAVKDSYQKLANEIENQFSFITNKAGVKMEPWQNEGQPYANSKDMLADIQKNNHLFYFPSENGYGSGSGDVAASDHPLAQLSPKYGVPYNDLFRAVHDYFGHGKQGFQFGPQGEENAWLSHQGTLSDEAIPALTSETRGQNSWVNFGRHLRRDDGSIPSKGESGFVSPQERPFADQKAGLLPAEYQVRRDAQAQGDGDTPAAVAPDSALTQGRADASATSQTTAAPSSSQTQGVSPSQPVYQPDQAASIVADLTRRNDGSTFNLYKGDLIGTPHFAVSAYPERGMVVPGHASPEQVSDFVQKNVDLLQDPKNSIGTWFNKKDGKTYLDISVTTPDIKEAATIGKAKGQEAIFNLKNFDEISLQPHPASEFTPVGEEPPYQAPTFKDPMEGIQDKIAQEGGRDLGRVAKEQAAKGLVPAASTAMAVVAPAAAAALPDDDSNVSKYGKVALNILGAAGVIGAAVRGRQVPELSPVQAAASKGAAALWLGGKKAWKQAVGESASPQLLAASQKLLDRHLATTLNEMPNTKKLLALQKAGGGDFAWYDKSDAELNQMFGQDAPMVGKFFAAMSNNATVMSNATLAMKAYRQWKSGEPFTGFLPDVIENLKRAANNEPLNGRKIDNFAKAMSGDPNAVVADRWIMRAFGFNKGTAPTDTQYDFIENAINQLAQQTGSTPRQVQAAIWFGYKNAAEQGKNRPPSPPPADAIKRSIDLRHGEALTENRKFDKARAAGQALPFDQ